MSVYAPPGSPGSLMSFQSRYENFIGGQWVPSSTGNLLDVTNPATGAVLCKVPLTGDRSDLLRGGTFHRGRYRVGAGRCTCRGPGLG